ncbi:unnamed protein product [Candidula unifasciata]|uniref:Claudin n=1 Tax=Candidula unifasciata TaxID=100452 RepID=A0A8S3Z9Z6_9EUPU|nr:unnamed protein product [Candidula unifasciata]
MTPTARLWNLGLLLSCIGLVMYVVGFSTDWWCDLDNEVYAPIAGARINAHFGLWRKCITISVNNSERVISDGCEDMDNDETYKPAAKTLCSVGLILSILGVPIALLAGCSASPKAMAFGGTLILVGAVAAVVGSAVYIGKAKDNDDRLEAEYSSFLALIGSIVAGAGAICQLLSIRTGYYTLA